MSKLIKKRFDIAVTQANGSFSKTFDLDKNITHVKGVLLSSDKDDLLYFRGTQKIEINKEEVFPENFESKLLLSGIGVAPNQRYYDIGSVPAGNGTVKIEYKDNPDGRTQYAPYRVSLYLLCQAD
ncbi:MAG TPA: hypothetical protein PKA77_14170 [Chitinophagaceae bacterium]|jgi:hypothetical protein|nr:hypothetical protein [Chitinophagaceae bacterium]HMU58636.1 hypothetical protein [Chitinophagaceae bacterium]